MNKNEFDKAINAVSDNADYEVIETVYTFHPAISETNGKKQIADLYTTFGMRIIFDMYPTACKARALESDISKAQNTLESLKQALADLKTGYRPI